MKSVPPKAKVMYILTLTVRYGEYIVMKVDCFTTVGKKPADIFTVPRSFIPTLTSMLLGNAPTLINLKYGI